MRISVILAHPDKESFNHAIAVAAVKTLNQNGHEVYFHDLYGERFDPILLTEEIPEDAPLPPEIEKRCIEIAVAYEFIEGDKGEGVPNGLLKAKTALVFNTSNTEDEREKTIFGDPLETIWRNCIFGLCGAHNFYRKMFSIIVVSSEEQRKEWLQEVRQTVSEYFPKNK